MKFLTVALTFAWFICLVLAHDPDPDHYGDPDDSPDPDNYKYPYDDPPDGYGENGNDYPVEEPKTITGNANYICLFLHQLKC